MKSEAAGMVPWRLETNWVASCESIETWITVESSDYPIDDSDTEALPRKFPLALHPPGPQSGPCEIKVIFEQMYDVGQIYVRSTARAYEVYYTKSVDGSNEYLCTVRCGVAEREEEVLRKPCFSSAGEESGEEWTEEIVRDRETSHSEDSWVNIKAPDVLRHNFLDGIKTSTMDHLQDLYEATAQISDSEPCSSLTIRLLSLQDKSQIHVDEVYIYVTPLDSCPENDMHMDERSNHSSLMSMFIPAILQLSKSGDRKIQDSHTPSRVLENKPGTGIIHETYASLEKYKAHEQCENLNIREKENSDHAKNDFHERQTSNNYLPGLPLEQTLQQLISRFDRVEDICLRFEGKLMNHIEHIEARLQCIEDKLENISKCSQYSGLTNGTRIIAPTFSFSESNSSSIHSEQIEKENCLCNDIPIVSCDTDLNPSIADIAPEFCYTEGEKYNNDVDPKNCLCNNIPIVTCDTDLNPCIVDIASGFCYNDVDTKKGSLISNSKKKISVDDALAAALDGFIIGSRAQQSDNDQSNSSLCSEEAKFSAVVDQKLPSQFHIAVKALDFSDCTGDDENSDQRENLLDIDSELVVARTGVKSLVTSPNLHKESKHDIQQVFASNICAASLDLNSTCLDSECTSIKSDINTTDDYTENRDPCESLEISYCHSMDLAGDSEKTQGLEIQEEIFPISSNQNHRYNDVLMDASEQEPDDTLHQILKEYVDTDDDVLTVFGSSLDFEFPILEVTFTCDTNTSCNSSVQDLLCGLEDSNSNEQASTLIRNEHEYNDLFPIKDYLVDLEGFTKDMPENKKSVSEEQWSPCSLQLDLSLV